jgi:hypothetical protein
MRRILFLLAAASIFAAAAAVSPEVNAQQTQQQAPQQPPLITEFQKVEDQWSTAVAKQDQYTLETILSPTYIDISSAGDITTRNQQVAAMYEKGLPQPVTMEQRVVNVRLIEDVAVVDGTYVERTKLNGIEHEERGLFTHVYQHVRGVWVCVHSQRTPVVAKPVKEKAEKKKSDADLPFHIPFTHIGSDNDKDASQPASPSAAQQN